MKILGLSCFYHDSAAAIVVDGKIIAAAQEERFTRQKHTPDFPYNAIKYCLEESGFTLNEIDGIVFYDKPILKFERILSTFYEVAPLGIFPFIKSIPIWLKEKLFLKRLIKNNLKEIDKDFNPKNTELLFTEHHLSHAGSSFYSSNFDESAILTIDGVGEWCTASIGIGNQNKIKILKELFFPHSVGLLYSSFTYYLGFKVNSGEYKLMGLAPYGISDSNQTKTFKKIIKKELVDIKDDGSIFLNQKFFVYTHKLKMLDESKFEKILGIKKRDENDEILQVHCNLALAIQEITEEIIIKMVVETKKITQKDNLCLSGGVALNCVANAKISELNIFSNIYIQPASGDAGGALGAALSVYYMYYCKSRKIDNSKLDKMDGAYLGPYFSSKEIMIMSKKAKAKHLYYDSFDDLSKIVANLISEGNIIGWFQGRAEFGPRALGNRSILADARNPSMQKKLNLNIKYREGFRPFAPSVLEEDFEKFFSGTPNPYMLQVNKLNNNMRLDLPQDYSKLEYMDKLYTSRSKVQAITHVDFSARVQSVSKESNFRFWTLINEFKKITGFGILVNTSFNVRGEPIVNSPEDAYNCFMNTEMDYLVIGNYFFKKQEQPVFSKKLNFEKD